MLSKFDEHLKETLTSAVAVMLLKVSSAVASFFVNIFLARYLGANDVGIYYLSLSIVAFSALLSRVGLDNVVVRQVATNISSGNYSAAKGVYYVSFLTTLIVGVVITFVVLMGASWLSSAVFSVDSLQQPLMYMTFAILPLALLTINAEGLRALKKIVDSQLVNGFSMPLFTLLLISFYGASLTLTDAVCIYVYVMILVLVLSIVLIRRSSKSYPVDKIEVNPKKIFSPCMHLLTISIMSYVTVWSGTFFLGIYSSATDVGIFSVALRTSLIVNLILISVNSVVAPQFAILHKANDLVNLENVARFSIRIMSILVIPILFVFAVFPEVIMQFYGDEFVVGSELLVILVVGQVVSALSGSVGTLLLMVGCERQLKNSEILGAAVNIIMMLLLVPRYGSLGAAVAVSSSVALKNVFSVILVKKYVGISLWGRRLIV